MANHAHRGNSGAFFCFVDEELLVVSEAEISEDGCDLSFLVTFVFVDEVEPMSFCGNEIGIRCSRRKFHKGKLEWLLPSSL